MSGVKHILAVDPGYSTGGYVLARVEADGALVPERWGCWTEYDRKAGYVTVSTWWRVGGEVRPNGLLAASVGGTTESGGFVPALNDVIEAVADGAVVVVEGLRFYGLATIGSALTTAEAAGGAIEALGVSRHDVSRPTWQQWATRAVGALPKGTKAREAAVRAVVPSVLVEQVEAAVGSQQARQAVYDAWGMVVWASRGGEG